MEILLYHNETSKESIHLTTEHAASSYGEPAMLVTSPELPNGSQVYGPGDILSNGLPTTIIVKSFSCQDELADLPEGQRWGELTDEARMLCRKFMRHIRAGAAA